MEAVAVSDLKRVNWSVERRIKRKKGLQLLGMLADLGKTGGKVVGDVKFKDGVILFVEQKINCIANFSFFD